MEKMGKLHAAISIRFSHFHPSKNKFAKNAKYHIIFDISHIFFDFVTFLPLGILNFQYIAPRKHRAATY